MATIYFESWHLIIDRPATYWSNKLMGTEIQVDADLIKMIMKNCIKTIVQNVQEGEDFTLQLRFKSSFKNFSCARGENRQDMEENDSGFSSESYNVHITCYDPPCAFVCPQYLTQSRSGGAISINSTTEGFSALKNKVGSFINSISSEVKQMKDAYESIGRD